MLGMPPTTKSPRRKKTVTTARRIEPAIETESLSEEPASLRDTLREAVRARRNRIRSVFLNLGVLVAGLLVGYLIWGYKPEPKRTVYNIETAGFPSLGPADAPIVIVEFSDYQCPYCWRWYANVYKPLLDAYPGKIRFVYRNYPLSFHPNAIASAEAALCAGDQHAYWQYHNALFDNYVNLYKEDQERLLDQATYNQFAGDLGLNVATFESCMTSHKYKQLILDDADYANKLPTDTVVDENGVASIEAAVGGTPTFFINGHRLGGAYPLESFKEIIDKELEKLD
jgi:protein-disulfide isomerase